MIRLDKIDKKILHLLQEDAKATTKEIAAKLDMTTTPIYERIKRLERHQIIKRYVALVDRKKVGQNLIGFCNVSLKEHSRKYLERFEDDITEFDEVLECYHITGQYDYLIKIVVTDMEAYHQFTYNHLAQLNNVGNVHTIFVMNDIKYSTAYPVEEESKTVQ